jgi:hypothetical protein
MSTVWQDISSRCNFTLPGPDFRITRDCPQNCCAGRLAGRGVGQCQEVDDSTRLQFARDLYGAFPCQGAFRPGWAVDL